jgi:hypothetical protein
MARLGGTSVFTDDDAEYLRRHQTSKVLDARVQIVGVAARSADARPTVLMCYPLRVTGQASAAHGTHAKRRERRGGSKRKWQAEQPVPWPNLYWLVDPTLCSRVGKLEHLGLVQEWQQQVREDEVFARQLSQAHRSYAATRWATLTQEDREYCLGNQNYATVLRDNGVGGLRFDSQIKCLHLQLAHTLAGGCNPVGDRVLACLARGDDAQVLTSAPLEDGGIAEAPSIDVKTRTQRVVAVLALAALATATISWYRSRR